MTLGWYFGVLGVTLFGALTNLAFAFADRDWIRVAGGISWFIFATTFLTVNFRTLRAHGYIDLRPEGGVVISNPLLREPISSRAEHPTPVVEPWDNNPVRTSDPQVLSLFIGHGRTRDALLIDFREQVVWPTASNWTVKIMSVAWWIEKQFGPPRVFLPGRKGPFRFVVVMCDRPDERELKDLLPTGD